MAGGIVGDLRVSKISQESPDMTRASFEEFVEDIRANGQLVPILIDGDEVIDGRKRLKACEVLGLTPKVINLSPGQSANDLAYSLNILRTHYTPSQRAMFAAKRAQYPSGTAKSKLSGKMRNGVEFNTVQTIAEAAHEAGVSRYNVISAKRLRREAAPEVVQAVESGKLTLHGAQQIVKEVPRRKQAESVAKAIAGRRKRIGAPPKHDEAVRHLYELGMRSAGEIAKRLRIGKPTVVGAAKRLGISLVLAHEGRFKSIQTRIERALDHLESTVDLLVPMFSEVVGLGESQPDWRVRLVNVRATLTRIIRAGGDNNGHEHS